MKTQLPVAFKEATSDAQWMMGLNACHKPTQAPPSKVNTAAMYTLRKELKGLVCGPLDKNGGELWFACPCLYQKALDKAYPTTGEDYQVLHPRKVTAHQIRVNQGAAILDVVTKDDIPKKRQRGGEEDVLKAWKVYYKRRGWDKIARFNNKGRLGTPYLLFKAKNVTDPAVRKEKWAKARPIAPTCRHPMSALLHLVGRAWHYVASQMTGEHFIASSTKDVPGYLQEAMRKFRGEEIEAHVLDIEGCYPNMPKEIIRFAMRALVEEARRQGREGVSVPSRSKTRRCTWKRTNGGPWKFIEFSTMLDMLDFSLDQAIFRLPNGKLIRQMLGIPMGDALSPGMTIGTCGWMEREWMASLDDATKRNFMARRYMDDILLLMRKGGWDSQRFYEDFRRSECYARPLNLEEASDGTFLETFFTVEHDRIEYRLKNANEGDVKKVWRYQSWESYSPSEQKRRTLVATLKKVAAMASSEKEMMNSAMAKLREFADLGYPASVRKDACCRVASSGGGAIWIVVALTQR